MNSETRDPDAPRPDRRAELTDAAFHAIARKGFEGLRVREVAGQVGINGATLHHYFATKEDLIRSVIDCAIKRLRATMEGLGQQGTAKGRLHDHINRLHRLMEEDPDLFVVLTEVNMRAHRTPAMDYLLEQNRTWHGMLKSILEEGIARHEWSDDLDPDAAAASIITFMEGITFWATTVPSWAEQSVRQLERWLGTA